MLLRLSCRRCWVRGCLETTKLWGEHQQLTHCKHITNTVHLEDFSEACSMPNIYPSAHVRTNRTMQCAYKRSHKCSLWFRLGLPLSQTKELHHTTIPCINTRAPGIMYYVLSFILLVTWFRNIPVLSLYFGGFSYGLNNSAGYKPSRSLTFHNHREAPTGYELVTQFHVYFPWVNGCLA